MNWKIIEGKGNNNYEINENGEVRNIKTGKILKTRINSRGYYHVDLSYDKGLKIHRLLALAFIPNPENKPCVDHIDRNSLNNNLLNLRWVTISENKRNSNKQKKESSSKYKGVNKHSKNRFRARIMINKKNINLGNFEKEEEAAKAYNNYIIEHSLEDFFVLNDLN
jgi:hypothetical protein